jgi:beta-phosphoglucomutase-like phosphatase (HAD superfamily)
VHEGLVLRGKPAPDIFLRAAHELAVPPAACTVVEDAPSGIRAAVAAGMQVVGVSTNHPEAELRAAGAVAVVPALADLGAEELLGA